MLLPALDQVLMSLVYVAIRTVDIVLYLVQLASLGVDHILHIFLHFQCIDHPSFDLFDLFLLDLDHSLIVKRLLVHFVHLYLDGLPAIAVIIFLVGFDHPGFADL